MRDGGGRSLQRPRAIASRRLCPSGEMRGAGRDGPFSLVVADAAFAVQTEVLMCDVALDIAGRAITATACLTAWFDRDASLQEHLQRALVGTRFENLVRPGKVDFE